MWLQQSVGWHLSSPSSAFLKHLGAESPKPWNSRKNPISNSVIFSVVCCSFADIRWVFAAFSAVPTGRTFWLLAGKSFLAALPCCAHPLCYLKCAAASQGMVSRNALWEGYVAFPHFLLNLLHLNHVCCLSAYRFVMHLQLWWARAAVGHQEHEAAAGRHPCWRWSLEVEMAPNLWLCAVSSLHAEWIQDPWLPWKHGWVFSGTEMLSHCSAVHVSYLQVKGELLLWAC